MILPTPARRNPSFEAYLPAIKQRLIDEQWETRRRQCYPALIFPVYLPRQFSKYFVGDVLPIFITFCSSYYFEGLRGRFGDVSFQWIKIDRLLGQGENPKSRR